MIKVGRITSNKKSAEPLKVESYSTTPRSVALENNSSKVVGSHGSDVDTDRSTVTEPSSASDGWGVNRVRSAPSHFGPRENENLTETLLRDSEEWSLKDYLEFDATVVDDWNEAASGWGMVVPYPKYVVQQQAPPPVKSKKSSFSARNSMRYMDEDLGDHYCPSWKCNVEPVTYRYVPNNGYYRNHKPMRDMREWPVMRRTKSEKAPMTPEMRHAQKTLKRELDSSFKNYGEDAENNPDIAAVRQGAEQRDVVVSIQGPQISRLPKCEQQLIKSASDLFMEKFNTRLSALEKEMQIPRVSMSSKKSMLEPSSSSAPSHSPRHLSKKLKEARGGQEGGARPTIQSTKEHAGDFGEDLFTVIPVSRMCKPEVPLRPLEKLTPKQKQLEKSSAATSQHTTAPSSPPEEAQSVVEEEDKEDKDLMIVLACATSHPQPLANKDPNLSGISTARSAIAMTNIDIEKMRNISLQSEFGGSGGSKPGRSSLVHKDVGGTMRYTVGGGGDITHQQPLEQPEGVDRKVNRLGPGYLGNALPEIMGKRLSVITNSHRLL